MTERLTALLHEEASGLDVPPTPTAAVLGRGRRLRTRRRVGSGLAAALALTLVGGSAVLLQQAFRGGTPSRPDTVDSAMAAYVEGGAYAVGSHVYLGSAGERSVDVEGKVKALYYTSAGIVVRTGQVPWTDSAGASHYALVTPEGRLRPLALTLGDVKPGTSPTSPYLAYAERGLVGTSPAKAAVPQGSYWTVHFLDVRTGRDAATSYVRGAFTWGGWAAPPVALDGDTAYVGLDRATVAVERGGAARAVTALSPSRMPEVAGGHGVVSRGVAGDAVVDVTTGRTLVAPPEEGADEAFVTLSPDGRYAVQVGPASGRGESTTRVSVRDLATGRQAPLSPLNGDYGWTPDGHVLHVSRTTVAVCSPVTGACRTTKVELSRGTIRIGGNSNES